MNLRTLGIPSEELINEIAAAGHRCDHTALGPAHTGKVLAGDLFAIVAAASGELDVDAFVAPAGQPNITDPDALLLLLAADRLDVRVVGWPGLDEIRLPRVARSDVDIAREEARMALLTGVQHLARQAGQGTVEQIANDHALEVVPHQVAAVVATQLANVEIALSRTQPDAATAETGLMALFGIRG